MHWFRSVLKPSTLRSPLLPSLACIHFSLRQSSTQPRPDSRCHGSRGQELCDGVGALHTVVCASAGSSGSQSWTVPGPPFHRPPTAQEHPGRVWWRSHASQQSAGHSGNTLQLQGLRDPSSSRSQATSQLQISSFESAVLGAVTPQESTDMQTGSFHCAPVVNFCEHAAKL